MKDKPAVSAKTITPSDDEPNVFRAVYIGTGGDVTLRCPGDSADVVFKNLPDGSILPVETWFIRADGTTAEDLVGLL